MLGAEDISGSVARLSISHYPNLRDASLDCLDSLFPLGTVILIREPNYRMNSGIYAMIMIHSPSDIVALETDDPILKGVRWRFPLSVPKSPSSAEEWRARGTSEFKAQRWLSAAVCYTKGLKMDKNSQVLRLNRAETYLRLGWYFSSLHDVEQALRLGTITDASLARKALLRSIRANYGMGRYERVVRIAGEHAHDVDCEEWLAKAKKRIDEQTFGNYDWYKLFTEGKKPNARLDVAEFRGPVEVRERKGQPGVRGVFATRDVEIGELLVRSLLHNFCAHANTHAGRW